MAVASPQAGDHVSAYLVSLFENATFVPRRDHSAFSLGDGRTFEANGG